MCILGRITKTVKNNTQTKRLPQPLQLERHTHGNHEHIGKLVLSQWHTCHASLPLAQRIRAARHLIQQRREAKVDWNPLLAEIDAMATAATLEDTTKTTKKEA